MKNLTKILFAGSLISSLTSCRIEENKYNAPLTKEDFVRAEWEKVPYQGEIWANYMNENIGHSEANWKIYCDEVARKNRAKCANLRGLSANRSRKLVGLKGEYILIPDLDKNGYVAFRKNRTINVVELAE